MAALRFIASTYASGRRRTITVVVHETAGDLRAAAQRYSPAVDQYEGALAVMHPRERHKILPGGFLVKHHDAGILRVTREQLSVEIVAHEVTHAALAIWRQDADADADIRRPDEDDPTKAGRGEETLCYLVGELVASVSAGLVRHGVQHDGAANVAAAAETG